VPEARPPLASCSGDRRGRHVWNGAASRSDMQLKCGRLRRRPARRRSAPRPLVALTLGWVFAMIEVHQCRRTRS
jgi:hypothetical protein